ncbi:chaperone protein DNAJ [Angomonas deanei]|nr:chaperone protein DNAJ [Angomonas deanei]|eukprot:EPY39731.1 chaperone protein DNAJ [Angomonas deanei]
MNYDDLTGTIHRHSVDKVELRSFSLADFLVFICIFSFFAFYYSYNAYKTQQAILQSRTSYTVDDVKRVGTDLERKSWHPWMADRETRDTMDDIGLIQGNVRQEVVDERRKETPRVYTPWQSGGPFARNSERQKYDEEPNKSA